MTTNGSPPQTIVLELSGEEQQLGFDASGLPRRDLRLYAVRVALMPALAPVTTTTLFILETLLPSSHRVLRRRTSATLPSLAVGRLVGERRPATRSWT